MRFKAIERLCKKQKLVCLYNRVNEDGEFTEQWIGDGRTCYPISNLPQLDESSVLTIFGVAEKDRGKWVVRVNELPDGMCFEDNAPGDALVEQMNLGITYDGHLLIPLRTQRGMVLIQDAYLAPMGDVLDVLELFERTDSAGNIYIVGKAGFVMHGAIYPYNAIKDTFVELVELFAADCRAALRDKEARAEFAKAGQPVQVMVGEHIVDTGTGEVVDA